MQAKISIVIPVFNETKNTIVELYARLKKVLDNLDRDYEIIFIDDGSTNGVFDVLADMHERDKKIKVIRLIKNFGQSAAFLAGFEYAKGDVVITMDADLQNIPEDIPRFLSKINEGYELVSGHRVARGDSFLIRRLPSFIMNKIISARAGLTLHDWGCSFNAAKKSLINSVKSYGTNSRFIKQIAAKSAGSVAEISIEHYKRREGKSRYSLWGLTGMAVDFLINYFPGRLSGEKPIFVLKETIE